MLAIFRKNIVAKERASHRRKSAVTPRGMPPASQRRKISSIYRVDFTDLHDNFAVELAAWRALRAAPLAIGDMSAASLSSERLTTQGCVLHGCREAGP